MVKAYKLPADLTPEELTETLAASGSPLPLILFKM